MFGLPENTEDMSIQPVEPLDLNKGLESEPVEIKKLSETTENKNPKRKVFVTGGTGFIAGHVIEELQFRGYKVVTNIRSIKPDLPSYLEYCEVSFTDNRDETGIRMIVEKVDGVINLAGILGTTIKSMDDLGNFIDNNINSSVNVIKACQLLGVPLIQIAVGNYFENNWYAITKTTVEHIVLGAVKYLGLKANVVRGLNAFGPRQKVKGTGKIIPTFITKALKGENISVYGGKDNCGIMDMIFVKDLAIILVNQLIETIIGEYPIGQVIDGGTGVGMSVYEIAETVIKLTNSSSQIEEVPMRLGEGLKSYVVASKPYPLAFTPFEEALLSTIEYYKTQ